MRTMKNLALAAMAASALALAGCGGGGSGGTASTPSEMPAETPTPAELAATASGLLDDAQTAVNAVMDDSDDAAVAAADTAVAAAEAAVMAASDADNYAALSQQLGALQGTLSAKKASRMAATDAADDEAIKAAAAKGKALYGKLAYDADDGTDTPQITSGKLNINPEDPADSTIDAVMLDPVADSGMSLGSWNGMDYMKSTGSGSTKVTTTARVYTNQGEPKSVSFTDRTNPSGLVHPGSGNAYTVFDDTGTTGAHTADPNIAGGDFPGAEGGRRTYAEGAARMFAATYRGAAGNYACTGTVCSATATDDGITLVGDWTFTPAPGAMVSIKDDRYVYFGWWLREDADGPTHASAFYNVLAGTGGTPLAEMSSLPVSGKATYNGQAAGKFAIRHGADANAGHFTADAMLTAEFDGVSGTDSKLSGTIDNFMLNDATEASDWSVSLKEAEFAGSAFTNVSTTAAAPAAVWSVGGDAAPGQTGQWEARAYDEEGAVGGVTSDVPTTVAGKFEAGFGATHKMVGAFGATK